MAVLQPNRDGPRRTDRERGAYLALTEYGGRQRLLRALADDEGIQTWELR